MQYSRSCFAAVALDGCIYALGGYGNVHLSSVERYDPKRDKWSLVPAMSTARNNFGACALHGFIYAVGEFLVAICWLHQRLFTTVCPKSTPV